jgi:hypothetical protein
MKCIVRDFPTSCILIRTGGQGLSAHPIDLREIGYEDLDWIEMAENKESCRSFGHGNAREACIKYSDFRH